VWTAEDSACTGFPHLEALTSAKGR
jgi:hypothetical protein